MKLECSIEKVKSAISAAERITGKNLTLPILSSVLLVASNKSLIIRATNLSIGIEIEVPAKIEEDGVTAVRGGVLNNLFSALNTSGNVSFEMVKDTLKVSTKNNSLVLNTYPYDDFPIIPLVKGDQFTISSKKLLDGLRAVYYSSSISDVKPEIASVYAYPEDGDLVFVATDSFRLAEKKIKTKSIKDFEGFLIPARNTVEIIKILSDKDEDATIAFTKNQISITMPGVYITSRLIDGIFPDYRQIMPKEKKTEVNVLKADILNALKISNIFADKFNQITLNVHPKQKKFEIFSKNSDVGENNTIIEASLSGDPIEVTLNFKYFFDCFQSIPQDSINIAFLEPNRPVVIQGNGDNSFTYLIMPMNK